MIEDTPLYMTQTQAVNALKFYLAQRQRDGGCTEAIIATVLEDLDMLDGNDFYEIAVMCIGIARRYKIKASFPEILV